LISGTTVALIFSKSQCPEWDQPQRLAKNWMRKVCLEIAQFFYETPSWVRLPICPFEKGTRWARILVSRNYAQSVAPASTKYLSSALSWLPAPTVSLMDGAGEQGTWREKVVWRKNTRGKMLF
jgi:hypothetical protein